MQKSKLSIQLSKLHTFQNPNVELEQYSTPGDIAADILWNAFMNKDIEGKVVADFASGPGIFAIGALLLGAKKVYLVDKSKEANEIARQNIADVERELDTSFEGRYEIVEKDVAEAVLKADTVVQNPPFGTKETHADKEFLETAFKTAPVVYSVHKTTSKKFIDAVAKDSGFAVTHYFEYDFPLKATMKFHKKKVQVIKAGCWRLARKHL